MSHIHKVISFFRTPTEDDRRLFDQGGKDEYKQRKYRLQDTYSIVQAV